MTLSEQLWVIYSSRGADAYFGEVVSTLEHGLQAAYFADRQSDARHEVSGSTWLAQRFGPEVSEPVRLHVPAKRFLCAMDPGFLAQLSPASVRTLALQGGPMSAREIAAFRFEPFQRDAIELRRFDDRGKVAGLQTADFAHYRGPIDGISRH